MPSDWLERLEGLKIPCAVSPLHDKDVWKESDQAENPNHKAGKLKKPHYHVVFYFESLKSPNQVLTCLKPFGVLYVEAVEAPRAYNRYLCHLDQPDKAQYPTNQIKRLNGAQCDISKPNPTLDEQAQIRNEILTFVRDNNVTEYAELTFVALNEGWENWLWYIEHHTIFLNSVIKSAAYSGINSRKSE
jgi:hypothetical protein